MTTISTTTQRTPMRLRLLGRFWREVNTLVPKTQTGDRLITWLRFLSVHRRLPRRDSGLFNDRLYFIKTSGALLDPLRVLTSDKELVKLYVKAVLGDAYNVPTLAVLRTLDECRRHAFPARCVVKATHCSGATLLRHDGEAIDFDRIAGWFDVNYYEGGRESNYRQLRPKVIVEPYVFGDDNPNDYKFFCVNGQPRIVQVDSDRHVRHTRTLFDTRWKPLPVDYKYPRGQAPARPVNLDAMLEAAARLSEPFDFVRVDLYSDGRELRVGELTHCPESGRGVFHPRGSEREVSRQLFEDAR
jgi:hypothetical protein